MATRQAVHRRIWRFLTVSIVSIFIQCDLPLYHHEQAAEAAHLNIEPRLRIKSAFAGTVWDLDIDPSETFITVPNAAKSVTVWPIDNDKQSQLLRVPLRNEEATKARPSAISPDSTLIAYAAPMAVDARQLPQPGTGLIYILGRTSSRVIHTINDLGATTSTHAMRLRFSPDGLYLAAVLNGGCGIRIWSNSNLGPDF